MRHNAAARSAGRSSGSRTVQLSAALVIFVATIAISLIGLFGSPQLIERSLFRPYWFQRRKEYSTVIMSGFVHADLMHLIFNMMTFYFFAFPLERYIGTLRFVVLYLAGLLISHAGTYYKQRSNPEYACLGASGAISAVLFAAIVYFRAAVCGALPRLHVLRVEASARPHQSRCASRGCNYGIAVRRGDRAARLRESAAVDLLVDFPTRKKVKPRRRRRGFVPQIVIR